jgi:hypothetical protein
MKKSKGKSCIFFTSLLFCFIASNADAQPDVDQNFIDQETFKKNDEKIKSDAVIKKPLIDNTLLDQIKNIKKNSSFTSPEKKDRADFSPKSSTYSIPLLNSNFELGHSNWTELYKYNGDWYDTSYIITNGSGGYGNWYANITNSDWLISDMFKIPINTQSIAYDYAARFIHWGTCSYGTNGVMAVIYDNTSDSVVDSTFHDASVDDYDYQYFTYYGSLYNNISAIGHDLSLDYISFNEDPDCTFALYLDNIFLTANRIDACTGGNCSVYRFQNKNNGTYLFIANENEANSVVYNYSNTFQLEGVAYAVPGSGVPMYRFQNKTNGTYLFTGEEEKKGVLDNYSQTFKLEGLAFYVNPSSGIPIYRFQNKTNGTYLFVGEAEKNSVLANYSQTFNLEGLAFYAN